MKLVGEDLQNLEEEVEQKRNKQKKSGRSGQEAGIGRRSGTEREEKREGVIGVRVVGRG
jgi:hypothetical protein